MTEVPGPAYGADTDAVVVFAIVNKGAKEAIIVDAADARSIKCAISNVAHFCLRVRCVKMPV